MTLAILLVAMIVILIGAEVFTNALEHLGERLGISKGSPVRSSPPSARRCPRPWCR